MFITLIFKIDKFQTVGGRSYIKYGRFHHFKGNLNSSLFGQSANFRQSK
jgi:hypothetical protein